MGLALLPSSESLKKLAKKGCILYQSKHKGSYKFALSIYLKTQIQAFTFKTSIVSVPVAILNIDRAWSRSAYNDVLDIPPREVPT